MKCLFFERYDKHVIEKFAIRTISKSYNSKYNSFISPHDTNNFDWISPDNRHALEITLVVSKNNMEGYIYEKAYNKGKNNLRSNHIKGAKLNLSGKLLQWQGGPISEITKGIQKAVIDKDKKARKRLSMNKYDIIDLCICIDDGGWFDETDFPLINVDLSSTIFNNIFFITSRVFFRYTREFGFEPFKRIVT